jgi:pimeloyl-ACP methyl ester carboxylesterase
MRRSRAFQWPALALAGALAACGQSGATPPGESPSPVAASRLPAPAATSTAPSASLPSSEPGSGGQLVEIGGRSLWLECMGEGAPTVILESGLGGDHRTWNQVQPQLAAASRVCVYDRAGIADSDEAPGTRTAGDAVDDLAALLDAAAIEPPYVLVGFSFGGAITQLFASTHPDAVGGLVLVESNHPLEAEQFEAHLTPDQIEIDRGFALDNPERMDPFASFEELQAAGPLPDVPLVVVTAGISEGWPPGWDADTFDALRAAQQADLATFTPQGRQVIAEESTHHVPSQQPSIIVEAVEAVLSELDG